MYHAFIGTPRLPPFWALGWQEVSYQGGSQAALLDVVSQYKDWNMPLDAMYLDKQSSNQTRNFALNTTLITNVTEVKA